MGIICPEPLPEVCNNRSMGLTRLALLPTGAAGRSAGLRRGRAGAISSFAASMVFGLLSSSAIAGRELSGDDLFLLTAWPLESTVGLEGGVSVAEVVRRAAAGCADSQRQQVCPSPQLRIEQPGQIQGCEAACKEGRQLNRRTQRSA